MRGPEIYDCAVSPEWIDYNGHMRDASYALVLSYACDALMVRLGMHETYRRETQCTLYTLEQHLQFQHEVKQPDHLVMVVRLLDADHKRLHLAFDCYCSRYPDPVAIGESILLHVRQGDAPAAAAFPPDVRAAIEDLRAATAAIEAPGPGSRRLGLRR